MDFLLLSDIFSALLAIFAVGFFFWMLVPSRSPSSDAENTSPTLDERSRQFGAMTGFMGGSVEDAVIAKYGVGRANGDAADNRDIATGVSMQVSANPPE